jgi:LmbE family N-acetylglucosaminyl deacetylase
MPATLTLMAVHAHPDDESSSTGGVLARYAAERIRTVVVTCTNGELGDGPGHVKPGQPGHVDDEVARTRLAELAVACEHLRVAHLELLGYRDSGMPEWPYKDRPDAFCNVPVDAVAERLSALFERYRPDVVITYDDDDGYNHPDHVQAHRATVAAVTRTNIPAKLYFTARRREDRAKLRELILEMGGDPPERSAPDPERRKRMELREQRITTTVDAAGVVERKRAALAAHASQLDQSWIVRLPPDGFRTVFGHETFIRAHDTTGAAIPEDDLFAGLH